MMIPYFVDIMVEEVNKETGLKEAKPSKKICYYGSNNNPYTHCKSCKDKFKLDDKYIMNIRRNGSAYCEKCKDEYCQKQ